MNDTYTYAQVKGMIFEEFSIDEETLESFTEEIEGLTYYDLESLLVAVRMFVTAYPSHL